MMKTIPILAAICLMCIGCNGPVTVSAFTKNSEIRLVVNGEDMFVYNEAFCQLGFNRDNCEFRVHDDSMSDYFILTLDMIPTGKGDEVTASVKWSTDNSENVKNNVAFNVVKVEGDRIWLWNEPTKTGSVVRILE